MIEKTYETGIGAIHYWINDNPHDSDSALVFLPGLTADHRLFDKQTEYFKGKTRLFVWDAPGHAASWPFEFSFDLMDKARWLDGILKREGIDKLLIINGHGGNNFKGFIRDLMAEDPSFLIFSSEWYTVLPRKDYFEADIDDHAGEQETSVMLHYYPELVRMDLAGEGKSKPFAIDSLNKKVAWHPRNWQKTTADTGIGNPLKASAEKGARYTRSVVEKYVELVVELTTKDLY